MSRKDITQHRQVSSFLKLTLFIHIDTGQLPKRGEKREMSMIIKEDRNAYESKYISTY